MARVGDCVREFGSHTLLYALNLCQPCTQSHPGRSTGSGSRLTYTGRANNQAKDTWQ